MREGNICRILLQKLVQFGTLKAMKKYMCPTRIPISSSTPPPDNINMIQLTRLKLDNKCFIRILRNAFEIRKKTEKC